LRTDPRFYLAAEPVERTEVPSLFRSSGVVEVLRNPPTFRNPTVGWDLWTFDEARIVEGRKRLLINGERKRLTLFPDGTMTFVASFNDFLGWPNTSEQFENRPQLNSVALIELVYNFARTYIAVVDFMSRRPQTVRFRCGFRDLHLENGRWVFLQPGTMSPRAYHRQGSKREAPAASIDLGPVELELSEGESGDSLAARAAYELILLVYRWFELEDDAIPFLNHETRRLDLEAFRADLATG
jgi:hypothetical protein